MARKKAEVETVEVTVEAKPAGKSSKDILEAFQVEISKHVGSPELQRKAVECLKRCL